MILNSREREDCADSTEHLAEEARVKAGKRGYTVNVSVFGKHEILAKCGKQTTLHHKTTGNRHDHVYDNATKA